MKPLTRLFIFITILLVCNSICAQMLPAKHSWTFGMGPVYGSVTANEQTTYSTLENEILIIQEGTSIGRSLGFGLHFGKTFFYSKQLSFQTEITLMHARRKTSIQESLSFTELIQSSNGIVRLNNLYLQFALSPRYQFGLFKRYYVSAGPYTEFNLLNFSKYSGEKVKYFEVNENGAEPLLSRLNEPLKQEINKRIRIRNWDFGGFVALGTLLAFPGKDYLQVEMRYSRGAFRVAENPSLRQNRFQILFIYNLVQMKLNKDYRAY
jgi:hypothetical protein